MSPDAPEILPKMARKHCLHASEVAFEPRGAAGRRDPSRGGRLTGSCRATTVLPSQGGRQSGVSTQGSLARLPTHL